MSHQSHPPWHDRPNSILWSVQVMKLLIMKSSPTSHHFLLLRSKYSYQHPVLIHPQCMASYSYHCQVEVFWFVTPCSVSEVLAASIFRLARLESSPPWQPWISHCITLSSFQDSGPLYACTDLKFMFPASTSFTSPCLASCYSQPCVFAQSVYLFFPSLPKCSKR